MGQFLQGAALHIGHTRGICPQLMLTHKTKLNHEITKMSIGIEKEVKGSSLEICCDSLLGTSPAKLMPA